MRPSFLLLALVAFVPATSPAASQAASHAASHAASPPTKAEIARYAGQLLADTYAAIAGAQREGLPMFVDGLRATVLTQAVVESAATESWVVVPT